MSAEDAWRSYADENYAVACLALERGYYKACLQNVQQAIEKYMKAALGSQGIAIKKTHNIELLNRLLNDAGIETALSNDECELFGCSLHTIEVPGRCRPAGFQSRQRDMPAVHRNRGKAAQIIVLTFFLQYSKFSIHNYADETVLEQREKCRMSNSELRIMNEIAANNHSLLTTHHSPFNSTQKIYGCRNAL